MRDHDLTEPRHDDLRGSTVRRAAPSRARTGRPGIGWLAAGYAGAAALIGLETVLRRPGSASSLKTSREDRGTTWMVAAAWGLAVDLPLVSRRIPVPPLPPAAAPCGVAVQAAGIAIRAWSMRALGASYTRTLRTDGSDQQVVDSGPYRWIRHPGYLGSLVAWTGFALASRSAPTATLVPALLGAAYLRRIRVEEAMLRRDLPGYADYCERTWRLVPHVW